MEPDNDYEPERLICNDCNGSGEGYVDGSSCSSCGGSGEILQYDEDHEPPCEEYNSDDAAEYAAQQWKERREELDRE